MRTEIAERLKVFWEHVGRAEVEILENTLGRVPPPEVPYYWRGDFEASFKSLERSLKRISRQNTYWSPSGSVGWRTPIVAESAHKALMFVLNPHEALLEEHWVLKSREYVDLKKAAMAEGRELQKLEPLDHRITVPREAKKEAARITLRAILMAHHFPKGDEFCPTPISIEKIQAETGWSKATVSRNFELLMNGLSLRTYKNLLTKVDCTQGWFDKFGHSLGIEAAFEDRRN